MHVILQNYSLCNFSVIFVIFNSVDTHCVVICCDWVCKVQLGCSFDGECCFHDKYMPSQTQVDVIVSVVAVALVVVLVVALVVSSRHIDETTTTTTMVTKKVTRMRDVCASSRIQQTPWRTFRCWKSAVPPPRSHRNCLYRRDLYTAV